MDSWKTTYKGIVSDDILNHLSYEKRENKWRMIFENNDPSHINYVVENKVGEIVGFIDGGVERTKNYEIDSELYAIYLLEDYQRMGIGKALVERLVKDLDSRGFSSMLVWVLKDNPSRSFYESYHPELIDTEFIEGLGVYEVAYAWKDLSIFSK